MHRTLVIAAVALLAAAGCHSSNSTAISPPRTTSVPTKSAVRPTKPPPRSTIQVTTFTVATEFTTANGDVGCDVESAYARCDIDKSKRLWTTPPEPSDCTSGWGHGIEMQLGSMASFFCGSDYVTGSKRILQAGHGIKVGFVECDALPDSSVHCKSFVDSHGFTVSRASYHLA